MFRRIVVAFYAPSSAHSGSVVEELMEGAPHPVLVLPCAAAPAATASLEPARLEATA